MRTASKPHGSKLSAWWSLLRGEHGLITFAAVLVGELLVARSFSWELLFPPLGPMLLTWGAFALNDYHGYPSDRALKRMDRPLVSRKLQRSDALVAGLLLLGLGLAFTWPVNPVAFAIVLALVVGSLIYDPLLKKMPLVGNAFIAATMAVPLLYGNAALTGSLEFVPLVQVLAGIAFLAGLGRELLKTLADVRGDRKLGAKTLPMLIGPKATVRLAALFSLGAVGLSLVPLALAFSPAYALLISLANLAILRSTQLSLESQQESALRKCRNYSLLGMGVGVLAFAALALGL